MAITKEVNIVVKETGMEKVNQSIQNLENSVEQTEKATKNFKTQIREANQELLKMSQKFGETSKEAVEAAKKVADLKDQMAFANDLVKTFNPDQKFKALGSATVLAGTGLQGVTAGMAMFGDQSESTEKALLKVQSAMAFSDAISNLSELGDQWATLKTAITGNAVATKVNNVATAGAAIVQKAFTGSVTTTTTGFKLLRGAIISTGIGALVVGVGMLIANFDKIKQVVLNFVPGLAKVGETIMGIVNAITDFMGVTSEAERLVDRQKSIAEKALKQNEKYLLLNEHKLTEAQKKEMQLRQEHFQRVADGEVTHDQSLKVYKEKLAIEEAEIQKEKDAKRLEEQKRAQEKAQAERQRANEIAKQKAQEQSNAEIEILKEKFADEKTSFEQQRNLILADTKITAEAKAQLIKEINKAEKEAIKKNNEDVENLKNEYKRKIEDLDAETELERIELEEERALAELERLESNEEAKLELIKYYAQLKKDLADQQSIDKKAKDKEDAKAEIEKEQMVADAKAEIQEATLDTISGGINLLKILGEKNKAIQKASLIAESGVGIAKIIQNTQTGNAVAVASPINAVDPTYSTRMRLINGISAGIGIATNLVATAKGLQALGGGSAGGGGSDTGGGGGGGSTPQAPSFNLIQGTGRNQIAESLQSNRPLKAFVVAKDVTTGQSLDRNILNSASI